MFDPITLVAGGVLLAGGWLAGCRGRKSSTPKPTGTVCSCSHGYGSHEAGGMCSAQVERVHYYLNGSRNGYEWVACPCLTYDGPEPLPRVWTGELGS